MKKYYASILLAFALAASAQAPAGYYNSATGTGYTLKSQLRAIITSGHNPQPYTTGLWSLYNTQLRDHFYENDNSLLDIYSENPNGPDPYNYTGTSQQCGNYNAEGNCYNKEHLIPQSYFNSAMPMYSDAHHVVPSDGKVNGWRNNLPFGKVSGTTSNPCNSGATNTPCNSQNGSKKGTNLNSGYSAGFGGMVFEPIDEFKGDVARSFLYFATRYETQMSGFYNTSVADPNGPEVTAMFDGSNNKVFSNTFLNILLTWNAMDPVSAKEIAFNNAIYAFQGNRNPYIDNNNYVTLVWGSPMATQDFSWLDETVVYPNPSANGTFEIKASQALESIEVFNLNGQRIALLRPEAQTEFQYEINGLPQGFYLIRLTANGASATRKAVVN